MLRDCDYDAYLCLESYLVPITDMRKCHQVGQIKHGEHFERMMRYKEASKLRERATYRAMQEKRLSRVEQWRIRHWGQQDKDEQMIALSRFYLRFISNRHLDIKVRYPIECRADMKPNPFGTQIFRPDPRDGKEVPDNNWFLHDTSSSFPSENLPHKLDNENITKDDMVIIAKANDIPLKKSWNKAKICKALLAYDGD